MKPYSTATIPRCAYQPVSGKVRKVADPADLMKMGITWCDTKKDVEGRWSWAEVRQWTVSEWNNDIKHFFDGLGQISWGTLEKQHKAGGRERNGGIAITRFKKEVQKRWMAIDNEQFDVVYRIRLTGRKRHYGIRHKTHFFLVWWDRLHMIYPVGKRGT